MRTGRRNIATGDEYNSLFPRAYGENVKIKRYAVLDDTVSLMKRVISTTLEDTRILAQKLKASNDKQTCANVWKFCFQHLQYQKDEPGKEQVRRPSRGWQDRNKGIDCDCMTVFVGSILYNLGIPFSIRLTRYQSPEFEHVYPVAHLPEGTIIMDCVVHEFNYEVPYTQKKDIRMELQYLNGFEDENEDESNQFDEWELLGNDYPPDAEGLILLGEDLKGLDGKAKRQEKKAARVEKRAEKKEEKQIKKAEKPPIKQQVKNVLHVVNRVNPATVLLRAGILASMKLNLMNVASKLRFAYWTDAQAASNNMLPGKHQQLKDIHKKIEGIFFGAGGKAENLKEAILKGKGNNDKRVPLNGLGAILEPVYDEQQIRDMIGDETFDDEFGHMENLSGFDGLGSVSAAAAIAAASGAVATVAAFLKKLGELFKKGTTQSQQEIVQDNTAAEEEKTRTFSAKNIAKIAEVTPLPATSRSKMSAVITPEVKEEELLDLTELDLDEKSTDVTTGTEIKTLKSGETQSNRIVEWVKDHPIASVGIAAAVIGGTILAVKAYKASKAPKGRRSLNGLDGARKKTTRRTKKSTNPNPTTRRRKTKSKAKTPAKRKGNYPRVELL